MTKQQTRRKRYWPDGDAQRAKCPKCGKIGLRTMITQRKRGPICWQFHHGTVPGFTEGVRQAIICFVPID